MPQTRKFNLSFILLLAAGALTSVACNGGNDETRSQPQSESTGGALPSSNATTMGGGKASGGTASSSRATGGAPSHETTRTTLTSGGASGTSDATRAVSTETKATGEGGTTAKASGGTSSPATDSTHVASGGTQASNTQASSTKASGGTAGQTTGSPSTSTFPIGSGKPTVYIAGDSTAQTYTSSSDGRQGWGQRITEFFTTDVVFVNKAIGGRSSKSFIDEGRLDEILAVIKQGDYLFAQWGINDRYQSEPERYTDPATTFRTYLKQYIDGARKKNAIPVLLTPTPRHQYVNGVFENGFAAYCEAIIAVGKETNTPVIDVQTEALAYYTRIGDAEVSSTIMVDVLHFKPEGAYQMARIVADGVRESVLPIAGFVIESKL